MGGRVETSCRYCCKILELFNKLNYFLNHALISFKTAPSIQVLRQHIRGGGAQTCTDIADAGRGVQNQEKRADEILENSRIFVQLKYWS